MTRPLIVGVGNRQRGDDAVGPLVADRCAEKFSDLADCEIVLGDCTLLTTWLAERETLIIIDACHSDAAPGTLRRFDLSEAPLPAYAGGVSTHGFGVTEAAALADALGDLPKRCIVLAIEGEQFELGQTLSDSVRLIVDRVVSAVAVELTSTGRTVER